MYNHMSYIKGIVAIVNYNGDNRLPQKVGKFQPHYTVSRLNKSTFSCAPPWEPYISYYMEQIHEAMQIYALCDFTWYVANEDRK